MIIIFDLDGTLLNTIDDLGYACNYALEHTGYPTHPIAEYPRMVGNGINNLIWRALPEEVRTEENILRVREFFANFGLTVLDEAFVTIGDNCTIGAGSVVTHDIPSDSVAADKPPKKFSL